MESMRRSPITYRIQPPTTTRFNNLFEPNNPAIMQVTKQLATHKPIYVYMSSDNLASTINP